ncbi:MAG: hypothetical protein PHU82_02520 [Candidatus Pacebacteria bacterium]|jgi:hypothetical protein|nr:hypothetical protein [Candidatus Paceibacterota bacterium]MDD4994811.1 hypothetical protein [Candidatus Paceibacterota bacterium]
MSNWRVQTKNKIKELKKQGFYKNWGKKEFDLIIFFIYPNLKIDNEWFKKRINSYKKNAKILKVKPPKVNFFLYPSIEIGKKLGTTPAICFIKMKEIHGHLNQSPGHELTHILLGKINDSKNLPGNGLWQEGLCTYLNGTNTNQKKHALSLDISEETFNIPWESWSNHLPGSLYPLAGSIVQYIVKVYGWNKIILFLKKLRNSAKNQNKISLQIFKKSLEEIQKDWLKWIKKG